MQLAVVAELLEELGPRLGVELAPEVGDQREVGADAHQPGLEVRGQLVEVGLLGTFVAVWDRAAGRYGAAGVARAGWALLGAAVVATVVLLELVLRA